MQIFLSIRSQPYFYRSLAITKTSEEMPCESLLQRSSLPQAVDRLESQFSAIFSENL